MGASNKVTKVCIGNITFDYYYKHIFRRCFIVY